jgi:hypothetical protein
VAGKKIQSQVTDYHEFVINKLIGVEGTSVSDVVARIIGYWINDHQKDLAKSGASRESWQTARTRPGRTAINVVNYSLKKRTTHD